MRNGPAGGAARRLAKAATRALLSEAAAAPKPGLVDRSGSGSHDDMDFMTFADSALALAPTFASLAEAGMARGAADPVWALSPAGEAASDAAFLAELRRIGLAGEAAMFAASGGVNTHKGALFLLGLLSAAAGALVGAGARPAAERVRLLAARTVRGLCARELDGAASNGGRAFREHGSRGARGEAEAGFPSLDSGALSVLRSARAAGRRPDDADCLDALLSLMTVCDDTTVLHRGGAEGAALVRKGAARVLAAGALRTNGGRAELARFSAALVERRLSPGGAADLLSCGLFLAEIESSSFFAVRPLRRELRDVPRDLGGRGVRRQIRNDVLRRAVPALQHDAQLAVQLLDD